MKFIFHAMYWVFRFSSAAWHWFTRRFTPAGLCVAGGLVAAAAMAVDENTIHDESFALLLALLVFAVACSFFFHAKFSATRLLPPFGTAGQPLYYQVEVQNLTAKPQVGLDLLEDLASPYPDFEEWLAFEQAQNRRVRPFSITKPRDRHPFRRVRVKTASLPPLAIKGQGTVRVEMLPLRRGVLLFAGVTVACPDPLGLFRSFSRVRCPQSMLILPKRYPLPPIALPGGRQYQQGGVALAANIGCSEEFVSLRDYRHGDPLRHIHWRSWAKSGKPIVKEFEDEFFMRHALVLDTFTDDPHSEVLEEAVSLAASFACTVLTQESLLDLLFVGNKSYCFTAGRGLGTADQMLEILAAVRNCDDKPFASLEHLVFAHLTAMSGCVCIFQKWDDSRRKFVQKLQALKIPLLALIVVPSGGGLSGAGGRLPGDEGVLHVLEAGKIPEGLSKLK